MEAPESVLAPGYRLDRYELLCPIASGGMATVWLARLRGKRGFEKLFAIKTIKTELITDPRYQEMFLDEARIASGIEHPNVAQILDLGEQDDTLYIVMEWVDGESLAKVARLSLKRSKRLPLEIVLRLMADACAGLHAAHELGDVHGANLGIVHRDVSPQNLLVTTGGAVKVIDFGVAKARSRSAGDTQSGVVKGKIRYMAPEQVHGRSVDRRADVWALGMCLHELVSGQPPFPELSDLDLVRHLMTDDPVPRYDSPDLPPALRKVFARSLAKDPNDRFATAAAMRRAIETAIEELDLSVTSEDVADYVRQNFPELEKKRRETIGKAIEATKDRPTSSQFTTKVEIPDELALAPTMIGEPVPPTQKVPTRSEDSSRSAREDGKSTGGATLTEQLGPRPQSRAGTVFFVVVLALGLGGWFVWPGGARIRAAIMPPPAPTAPALPSASASVAASSAPPALSTSAPASASSAEPESSAIASADPPPASASASVAGSAPPPSLPPLPRSAPPRPTVTASGTKWVAIRNDAGVIEWITVPKSSPAPGGAAPKGEEP